MNCQILGAASICKQTFLRRSFSFNNVIGNFPIGINKLSLGNPYTRATDQTGTNINHLNKIDRKHTHLNELSHRLCDYAGKTMTITDGYPNGAQISLLLVLSDWHGVLGMTWRERTHDHLPKNKHPDTRS